eukprot:g19344.t1
MLAAKLAAAKPAPPRPTPSLESIAQQLGVDLAAEPELMHLVSQMRTSPLPPTWTIVAAAATAAAATAEGPSSAGQQATLEYVHRWTGERTVEHPGTSYFAALVEQERRNNRLQGLGGVSVLSAPCPQAATSYSCCSISANRSSSSGGSIEGGDGGPKSPTLGSSRQDGGHGLLASSTSPRGKGGDDGQATASGLDNGTSEIKVLRGKRQDSDARGAPGSAEGDGDEAQGSGTAARKRPPGGTRGGKWAKGRVPPPKWLVFTSWWHETVSGTENVMNRKHASIRYNTANASFEVELEDVPAIFEVSHATGRLGKKIGTVDIRVGAQISILGRQMRLMQCDGLTAQWLESESRAITKAKAALISALERGRDNVRVTCRSDRLERSASAQRGSGSVGQGAEMDRRALMQDVVALRDALAQTQPDEAMRLTKDLAIQ